MKKLYYFNHANDVNKFILKMAYSKNVVVRQTIEEYIEYFMLIENTNAGHMKLEILNYFGRIIKHRKVFIKMNPKLFNS